jgi:hypothetical protein
MKGVPWVFVKIYFKIFLYYQYLHHFAIHKFKKKSEYKVFCIGMIKTGTTSMYKAYSLLGFRAVHFLRLGNQPTEGWVDYIKKCNYDAFSDIPMSFGNLFKELEKAFPNSKFILTLREKESLKKSLQNYFQGSPYEIKNLLDLEDEIKKYEERNNEIIQYFKNKPGRLLVMNLFDGDGWNELCNFLNKPIPNKPFPHLNKTRYKK